MRTSAPGGSLSSRVFTLIAAALLVIMTAAEVGSMLQESQTIDEGYHLLAGYQFLKTGQPPAHHEQPPLSQALSALPLLPLNLRLPDVQPLNPDDAKRREHEFFFDNVRPVEEILTRARAAHLLTNLLLGILIAWWMRRHFGDWAALASLALFAFDPNFLAHGHYVTNDAPVALSFLGACLAWSWFLDRQSLRRGALASLAFAAAFATKYNSAALLPIFAVLYAIHWWRQEAAARPRLLRAIWSLSKTFALMGLITLAFFFALFRFQTGRILPPDPDTGRQLPLSELMRAHPHLGGPLRGMVLNRPQLARTIDTVVDAIPLPAPALFQELYYLSSHAAGGHQSYLLGQLSDRGWWYYFPVVLAVKTPTGDLLLLVLSMAVAAGLLLRGGAGSVVRRLRETDFRWYVLSIPPLFYFVICIRSSIDLGVRHVLLIYPFLFMGIGAVLFSQRFALKRALRLTAGAALALVIVESALAYPFYVSFFNFPSGGASRGSDYLVDSNLDWGQDTKRLGQYVAAHGNPPVCLAALNEARPEHYGMVMRPFPGNADEARQSGCLVVISLTTIKESNTNGRFDWLVRTPPADRVGTSLLVYNFGQPAAK